MRRFRHLKRDIVLFIFGVGILCAGLLLVWAASIRVPDLVGFEERKIEQSTKIYDRTGEVLLYDVHQNIQRTVVPFDEIARDVKNATVAIEDTEFYSHKGVRPLATLRAVFLQPLRGKGVQGGSTITQQVVKNSLLTQEQKISRKLKEWVLSIKLERVLSKEEILALYLNESPYGGSIYGIEEASQTFFGKGAADLTLAESAYLAALPQAPTYYSPYGNNREALDARKNLVLRRMVDSGFITNEEYEEAKTTEVDFQPRAEQGIRAPHFVIYVREYLEQKYGQKVIEERGLRVITTLDSDLQEKAEEIVERNALLNKEKFDAENAALTAVDPKTGQILVMVGSRNYFDEDIDGNYNVSTGKRQPGSAFKPFVYATAFKGGYTPDTVVFDLKTQFSTLCAPTNFSEDAPCYSPNNYDSVFRGPITLRDALAQSVNVPAVKVLYLTGINAALRTACDMGLTTLADSERYGLTLVLGGGEVSLLEMTGAYGVFANNGIRHTLTPILRIEDGDGNILESFSDKPRRVIDESVALQISDVLSDNVARTPAFGANSYLYFPGRDVAVKTGTTNDYRDAWILGYTPSISAGAWAGNNDNRSMDKKVAGFIIAPLWNEFMSTALAKYPSESFPPAPPVDQSIKPILRGVWRGNETYVVDTVSGGLATSYTPQETREERVVTNVHSILQWVDTNSPLGAIPLRPENDPQYIRWENPVRVWAALHGIVDQDSSVIPTNTDTVHTPQNAPRVVLSGLKNSAYTRGERAVVAVGSTGPYPLLRAEFFVNGTYIGQTGTGSSSFSFVPDETGNVGENIFTVVVYDTIYNRAESPFSFTIN